MSSSHTVVSSLIPTDPKKYIVRSVMLTTSQEASSAKKLDELKTILRTKSIQNMLTLLEDTGMIKYHYQKPIDSGDVVELVSTIAVTKQGGADE